MTSSNSSSTPNTKWNGWRRMDCGILIIISSCYVDEEKDYQLQILYSHIHHFGFEYEEFHLN